MTDREAATRLAVDITIGWASHDNEDIAGPGAAPDDGWYIDVDLPNGQSRGIGRDFYGPGYASLDEAFAYAKKWAEQRGLALDMELATLTVKAVRPETVTVLDPPTLNGDPNGK